MKPIEREMRELWDANKKDIPNLRAISIEMTSYNAQIHGYILFDIIDDITCIAWEEMEALMAIIAKEKAKRERNEILFRNFKRVLHEENTIEKADSPVVDRALA